MDTTFTPSPGRIVGYTLTEQDAAQINKRRDDATRSGIARDQSGAVVHVGNRVTAGETYPMIITRVWSDQPSFATPVNGKVLLDGTDDLWVTSKNQGDPEGCWLPFPRV